MTKYIFTLFSILLIISLESCLCCGFGYKKRKAIFEACFEGTNNQTKIFLYKNKKFLIHASGIFGYSKAYRGTYIIDNDTLKFSFKEKELPRGITYKMYMDKKHEVLIPTEELKDTASLSHKYDYYYYFGSCKGRN